MISKVTLFSLLLGLMLALGIRLWSDSHPDDCTRGLTAGSSMPASEYVVSGTRQIIVPCNDWIMRMPLRIQLLCLLNLTIAVVFVLNALADLRGWLQARRRMRQSG